jgi:hypothetical protein
MFGQEAMDNSHIFLCSPLCTGRAEGIHKAGLQCGPQTQFSIGKAAKEEKRHLRKNMDTMDRTRGS